jgi:hypothetical protein
MGTRCLIRASDTLHLEASLQICITESIREGLAEPAFPCALTPNVLLVEQVQGPLEPSAELFTQQEADFEGIGEVRHRVVLICLLFGVLADPTCVFGE